MKQIFLFNNILVIFVNFGYFSTCMQLIEINEFLANSSYFYTIAIGMDSRYSYVSANYNRNFDFENNSLLGKHFSITLHADDMAICAEVGAKCFEHPEQLFPATLRKHDGRGGFVVTQWEMKALMEKGQPAGIFCIGYNVTDYVNTRSRLESATTEIAEKNHQLTEISFMQSHVIRKPLANILGLTSILAGMNIDANQKNINDMIITSAQELDLVIREISVKAE
ncbi:PAS domain-containing protein [Mucilaginibacter sp. FT3.2]|uniref:PAS domain-containing protein n=1 Tax=Mucilaginibacter sp. FT3.2 TaxID=2723090 RepID=UPI0016215296|nr:PAS domain-containing protein [Mucilaginibacter sp. FT3.2]MBB6235347.1 hypothetical protein [Mucilaginibacter sp. FT3.2]